MSTKEPESATQNEDKPLSGKAQTRALPLDVYPAIPGRPIMLKDILSCKRLVARVAQLLQKGEISLTFGKGLVWLCKIFSDISTTADLEARIVELEEKAKGERMGA